MKALKKEIEFIPYKRGEKPNVMNFYPSWTNDPVPPRHLKTKTQKKRK